MAQVNTIFVQTAPTRIQGSFFSLSAGQSRKFKGGPLGFHRKEIVITNDDSGSSSTRLYVTIARQEGQAAAQHIRIGCVKDGVTLQLETNEDLILFNPSISAVLSNIHVMEVFYTGAGALVI